MWGELAVKATVRGIGEEGRRGVGGAGTKGERGRGDRGVEGGAEEEVHVGGGGLFPALRLAVMCGGVGWEELNNFN